MIIIYRSQVPTRTVQTLQKKTIIKGTKRIKGEIAFMKYTDHKFQQEQFRLYKKKIN